MGKTSRIKVANFNCRRYL